MATYTWFYPNPNGAFGYAPTTDPQADQTTHSATFIISNANLADMVQATLKGRAAGAGTGVPQDLTAAQVRTLLALGTAALNNTGDFDAAGAAAAAQAAAIQRANHTGTQTASTISDFNTAVATAVATTAILKSLLTTQGDTIYATGASTPTRLAKGTALQVYRMNAGATAPEWATPTTRVPMVTTRWTAGDITCTQALTTTWFELAAATGGGGTGTHDLVIPAITNDVLELGFETGADAGNTSVFIDFFTTSGSHYVGTSGAGTDTGFMWVPGTQFQQVHGTVKYTVPADAISGGNATLRVMGRMSAASVNRVFYGTTTSTGAPAYAWVKNLGQ